jgi:hypothetical protein
MSAVWRYTTATLNSRNSRRRVAYTVCHRHMRQRQRHQRPPTVPPLRTSAAGDICAQKLRRWLSDVRCRGIVWVAEALLVPLTVGEAAAVAGDAAAPAAATRQPALKAKLRGTTARTNGAAARPNSGGDGGSGAGGAWRLQPPLGRTGRHSCA